MSDTREIDFNIFLNNIQKQFLCCYPLYCFAWQDFPKNLDWSQQKKLMDVTVNFSLNRHWPIKLSYQLNFLKKVLEFLESNSLEVHDAVYEIYCSIQQNLTNDNTEKFAFRHYLLKAGIHLTLRESKSFVAEGTTGLCSWQASLALADFLVQNPLLSQDKIVLELGSGTGLCGLTLLKICRPKHLLLTDGSSSCVKLMRENLKRNFPEILEENRRFKINEQNVICSVVPWNSIREYTEMIEFVPDIVIAADVVYDESCFRDLSMAIEYVFKLKKGKVEMYLAATVRNEHTLRQFINIMDSFDFQISECDVVPLEKSNVCWDRSTPVRILKLTK